MEMWGEIVKCWLALCSQASYITVKECPFTVLIVRHAHERVLHNGVRDTERYALNIGFSKGDPLLENCYFIVLYVKDMECYPILHHLLPLSHLSGFKKNHPSPLWGLTLLDHFM